MSTVRVCQLENEPEAGLVCAVLDRRRIPYTLIKTHDAVFDGLSAGQMDWGYIEAPDAYAEKILRIVADLHRKTTKETARDSNTSRRRISKPIKIAIAVVPVLALIVAYVAAVASNPVYKSYFYYNLGVTWAKIGRYDVAISKYSKALELNPRLSFAYGNRGAAWARQGEYDKAVADYDMVLEIEPKNPRAYYNRAFYLSKEGNHDRAIADYSKAIELYPRYEYAYVNRGLEWAKIGNYDNAIADYSIGIELDPKDTKAYVDRGFSWEHKGNYDKAILDFNKAIALDPKDRYAYEGRAFAWSKIGRSDKAEEDRVSSSKLRNGR